MQGSERMETRCPEEVLALIPWYPDGALSDGERGRVEAHAAQCPACREEIQALTGDLSGPEDLEVPPATRVLARVLDRIEADRSRREQRHRPPRRPGASFRPASAPLRRLALAAGLVAAAGLGALASGLLVSGDRTADPVYTTATAPEAASVSGPVVEIIPRDEVTVAQLGAVLGEIDGEVVAGPEGALGRYRIALPAGADAAAVAARLRAEDGGIATFAEPLSR